MYTVKKVLCLWFCIIALSACGTTSLAATSSPAHKKLPVQRATTTPVPTPALPTPTVKPSVTRPTRLIIPSIGVDASVENIGVLSNGDLATPTQSPWDDVGWYHLGPRPSENGSAVIAGHLDRPGGYPAVF